jgi:adenylate cyclase class 2
MNTVSAESNREVEIKLRLEDAAQGRRLLRNAGFRVAKRRVFEQNTLFDTAANELRRSGSALRLRTCGRRHLLTFKGPSESGRHKTREELELSLGDRDAFEQILDRLGYRPAFRYEKYRTEYRDAAATGTAMLDETPVGVYLELEGPPDWIDRTAASLGFSTTDYITETYAALHHSAGGASTDMVFRRP